MTYFLPFIFFAIMVINSVIMQGEINEMKMKLDKHVTVETIDRETIYTLQERIFELTYN